ncbi:acetolactate synthase isozyme 2 small subunit family protein [Pasteurella bettyae CCUG 2042]|uniref:Acetolactate synthase isozyme 2 small subunit family protein n=2 Tax=Pasteurella bettyae TaxID=752 RepID=I3DBS6_9PAST|nr:acetolactate synthase 2 small subunit [Pasteurella bettyae]EIJ69169.1 acetolactate synthase isozyme 2 small subunit family protein [Pasteurella bettyae CCUG 2042]SUB22893.1 IlvM [Pasteurella bettyae]
MKNEMTIVANHSPETLERILRVVRHRGFTVTNMKMSLESGKIWLDLSIQSDRDMCLLAHQLAKLEDVIDVTADDECAFDDVNHSEVSYKDVG